MKFKNFLNEAKKPKETFVIVTKDPKYFKGQSIHKSTKLFDNVADADKEATKFNSMRTEFEKLKGVFYQHATIVNGKFTGY